MKSPRNRGLRSWAPLTREREPAPLASDLDESDHEEFEGEKNKYVFTGVILFGAVLLGVLALRSHTPPSEENLALESKVLPYETSQGRVLPIHSIGTSGYPKATFGVGCFWSGEQQFQSIPGLVSTSVGYVGGDGKTTPTYEMVKANTTEYVEVLTIEFDPEVIRYEDLLKKFWRMHDPTPTKYTGTQYRSAVFFHSPEQKQLAMKAKADLRDSGLYGDFEIVTEIDPGTVFYLAEESHQNYYQKHQQKSVVSGH